MNSKYRHYQKGDEVREVEIYNSVISEMDPEFAYRTVNYIRYRYDLPTHVPENTLYLLNDDNEIVGYCALDLYSESAIVSYPFILKGYRNEKIKEEMFSLIFNRAKSLHQEVISHSYSVTLTDIHKFLETKGIHRVDETENLHINTEDLNRSSDPYIGIPITSEDVDRLRSFVENAKQPTFANIEIEKVKEEIMSGVFHRNQLLQIKLGDETIGFTGMAIVENPKTKLQYAYQNFMLFELADNKFTDLMARHLYFFYNDLKEKGVPHFRQQIHAKSPRLQQYRDLGFYPYEPNNRIYVFKT